MSDGGDVGDAFNVNADDIDVFNVNADSSAIVR